MTAARALQILHDHAPAGEPWPLHCQQVAKVAGVLADALADAGHPIDPDLVRAEGLLHDIGRAQTHGPLHGWSGFTLLRALGHTDLARGCLTHWLKGREPHELHADGTLSKEFVDRVFAHLVPQEWSLADSVISLADSSVQHTTIVPWQERHADLIVRYGDSPWIRRTEELAGQHSEHIATALGFPAETLIAPHYGDTLHA